MSSDQGHQLKQHRIRKSKISCPICSLPALLLCSNKPINHPDTEDTDVSTQKGLGGREGEEKQAQCSDRGMFTATALLRKAVFNICLQLNLFPQQLPTQRQGCPPPADLRVGSTSNTPSRQGLVVLKTRRAQALCHLQVRKSVVSSTRTALGLIPRSTLAVSKLRWLVLAL